MISIGLGKGGREGQCKNPRHEDNASRWKTGVEEEEEEAKRKSCR
jgi:hypothetical protein